MPSSLRLQDFDIDPVRGFVPAEDPLTALPPPFDVWDRLAADLPLLIMTGRVRDALAAMPILDAAALPERRAQRRALLLLAGFANTWVANGGPLTLPRCIAVPLVAVSRQLGMKPITTHANIVLGNWRRLDPKKPLSVENVDTLLTFRGSIDEKWFFLSTLGVELAGAPVLQHLTSAVTSAEAEDHARLSAILKTIAPLIGDMTTAFMRVRDCCDPHIFYTHVRPYLAGWPSPGLTYEGTDLGLAQLNGGSAAQSSLLQSIDAALGIRHDHELTKGFLTSMQEYMPPLHRAFIEELSQRSRVRTVVASADAPLDLRRAYDVVVGAVDTLRRKHIGLVSEYITKQMPPSAVAVGTGGTSFDDFLRQSRIETVESKLEPKHGG